MECLRLLFKGWLLLSLPSNQVGNYTELIKTKVLVYQEMCWRRPLVGKTIGQLKQMGEIWQFLCLTGVKGAAKISRSRRKETQLDVVASWIQLPFS